MSKSNLDSTRVKYLPSKPRIIFVAEAPPENLERFFYFEDVKTGDALFINLIRLLYPAYRQEHGGTLEQIRKEKSKLLKQFKEDGYYLIDALPVPISLKLSSKERVNLIDERKLEIAHELAGLIGTKPFDFKDSPYGVVLLKATVHNALADYLVTQGIPILNQNIKVPFPSHGHTRAFSDSLHRVLAVSDPRYRYATKFVWYEGDIEIIKPKNT
jgi:hypothetical protein